MNKSQVKNNKRKDQIVPLKSLSNDEIKTAYEKALKEKQGEGTSLATPDA